MFVSPFGCQERLKRTGIALIKGYLKRTKHLLLVKMEWKIVLIVLLILHQISSTFAVKITLRYICTVISGIPDMPDIVCMGMMDGEPFSYYDSNISEMIARQEWELNTVDPHYFERKTQCYGKAKQSFKNSITKTMKYFNHTGGIHTLQNMYGCDWDDETGITNLCDQYGYDGEDFQNAYHKNTRFEQTVTADLSQNKPKNRFLTDECVEWLKNYVTNPKSALKRKVPPERNRDFDIVHHITIVIGVVTALLLTVIAVIGFILWNRKSGGSESSCESRQLQSPVVKAKSVLNRCTGKAEENLHVGSEEKTENDYMLPSSTK
ncbi:hypothetical protein MATL_G00192910 [Megalops atlanticus]|uniref:MHC class I-like antigen recognition-like domain-containing protein n=1 Tax=Megalops atlanticus TaxID=7932 RepID=A0A9D3PLI6_MEGAT|nr:hypothetical protein MATL_G00192910 [Megalops atlanticus]